MAVFSLSFSDFWGPKGPRGGRNYLGLKFFWACFGPFPDVLAKKNFSKKFSEKKRISTKKRTRIRFFCGRFQYFRRSCKNIQFWLKSHSTCPPPLCALWNYFANQWWNIKHHKNFSKFIFIIIFLVIVVPIWERHRSVVPTIGTKSWRRS